MKKHKLKVVYIRPSRYDDDGYVLRYWRGVLPSNTLACLKSLTKAAARCFTFGLVEQVIVEMAGGYLFVARISDGSALGVVARRDADIGLIGYQMTLLVKNAGECLSPALAAELKNALTV